MSILRPCFSAKSPPGCHEDEAGVALSLDHALAPRRQCLLRARRHGGECQDGDAERDGSGLPGDRTRKHGRHFFVGFDFGG
jgi:hypothetical protein